jgi:hypothetical protein
MYVAMEDGSIYYLEIHLQAQPLIQNAVQASYLDCAIGTAFAALDCGLGYDDMIIAGGEMSSGGIYLVGGTSVFCNSAPTKPCLQLNIAPWPVDIRAKPEESVINWTPVFDFELVNLSASGHDNSIANRDRVFACTGRGEHGAITELRYGIQARAEEPADYLEGTQRVFILPDVAGCGYFVLSSHPAESFLCYRSIGRESEWLECTCPVSLELDEPTLAAGPLEGPGGCGSPAHTQRALWSVQVTPSSVTAVQLFQEHALRREERDRIVNGGLPRLRRLQRKCEGGDRIVAAALHGKYLFIGLRNGNDIKLVLGSIALEKSKYVPSRLPAVYDCSCPLVTSSCDLLVHRWLWVATPRLLISYNCKFPIITSISLE